MIIFFAGAGYKVEDSIRLNKEDNKQWGVLLSYKDQKTKDGKGSKRFQKVHHGNISNRVVPRRTRPPKGISK